MKARQGHVSDSDLSLYVDGELSTDRAARIREHLADCVQCAEAVTFLISLGEASRQPSDVEVPDVADEVIARRRAGERVVLDGRPGRRLPKFRGRAAAAIALLAIGGASALLMLAPKAGASRGELVVAPLAPTAGATIDFTYTPAFYLADQDSLRLRARARKRDTPFPRGDIIGELRVTTLHRSANGEFTGRIRLEPDDVFLAAAVEDFEARNVDTNFGQLWEVMVVDETGAPSLAAIESKYRILEPYNWVMASAWAGEVARQWPDNPFGWAILYWHESRLGQAAESDSLLGAHRAVLSWLIKDGDVASADRVAWLARYAERLGEAVTRDSLLAVLGGVDPNHEAIIDRDVERIRSDSGLTNPQRLSLLDDAWVRSGQSNEATVRVGVVEAALSGDSAVIALWLDRAVMTPGVGVAGAANVAEPFESLASERAAIYRREVEASGFIDDRQRPLRQSASDYRASLAAHNDSTSRLLARDLVAVGDTLAAVRLYRQFEYEAWMPPQIEPYIDLLLAVGDTASAVQGIGLLAADPIDGPAASSRYAELIERHLSAEDLRALKAEWVKRATGSLTPLGVVGNRAVFQVVGGEAIEAAELFANRPTVALLWDTRLPDASDVVAEFEALAAMAWVPGLVRPMIVTTQADAHALDMLSGGSSLVIRDPDFLLAQSARAFGLPTYVVLDSSLMPVRITPDAAEAFRSAYAIAVKEE